MSMKRNDVVVVISGADGGASKTGKILQIMPGGKKAIVEGIRIMKKHLRKSQDNPQGAIVDKEIPIALSNVQLYCPSCKKGVKVRKEKDGAAKIRKCRKCGHAFDS